MDVGTRMKDQAVGMSMGSLRDVLNSQHLERPKQKSQVALREVWSCHISWRVMSIQAVLQPWVWLRPQKGDDRKGESKAHTTAWLFNI